MKKENAGYTKKELEMIRDIFSGESKIKILSTNKPKDKKEEELKC